MASSGDDRRQDPTMALRGVVLYILRAASGLIEAELNDSGSATKPGFYLSHNPQTRAVFVEALGFGNSERQMVDRYKTVIGRALRSTLSVNPDEHVKVNAATMVWVGDLSDHQIATLRARYSA